jgi:hypothetical protein
MSRQFRSVCHQLQQLARVRVLQDRTQELLADSMAVDSCLPWTLMRDQWLGRLW